MVRLSKSASKAKKSTRTLPTRARRAPNYFVEKWEVHHRDKKPKQKLAVKGPKKGKSSVRAARKVLKRALSAGSRKALKAAKGKSSGHKRDPNAKLTPRDKLTSFAVNPLYETREAVPFVSPSAQSRLLNRAVLLKDEALLKALMGDVKRVSSLITSRHLNDGQITPAHLAAAQGNWSMYNKIQSELKKAKQATRVAPETSLINYGGTGHYNFAMLGHAVRDIQMGRGGREGNNALLPPSAHHESEMAYLMRMNVPFDLIQRGVAAGFLQSYQVTQNIVHAVRAGNRTLAGKLIQTYATYQFNELHVQVLLNKAEALKPFRGVSVKKKGQENRDVTPMHCACINPNPKYLAELLAVEPDFSHADANGWKCVHYAAVAEKADCLKLLLGKGASVFDVDKQHNTPLHHAAELGRVDALRLLAAKLKESDPGLGALNKKNRHSFAPIHLAAKAGHLDAVDALLTLGATLELTTGAGRGKMTALHLAAEAGHLRLVQHLHTKYNAQLDKKDKLKRTALTHAVKQGQAHVVSYLLRAGVDSDHPDSSGNTPAHYAAAFGWYFCMKLLLEAKAAITAPNDWQLTPLDVAYMKGHMGIADMLLGQPGIDINCQDDRGLTLVALTLTNGMIFDDTHKQLEYLLKAKKASATLADSLGNTPLHILAAATVTLDWQSREGLDEDGMEAEKSARLKAVLQLLLKHGADVSRENEKGETPLMYAVKTRKVHMALLLAQQGALLPQSLQEPPTEGDGANFLHQLFGYLATDRDAECAAEIFTLLAKGQAPLVRTLLEQRDSGGYTAFLRGVAASQGVSQDHACLAAVVDFHPDVLAQQIGKAVEKPDWEQNGDAEEEEEDDEEHGEYDEDGEWIPAPNFVAEEKEEITNEGQSAFHIAISHHNKTLDVLLGKFRRLRAELRQEQVLELRTKAEGLTPLLTAAKAGREDAAIAFIQAEADICAKTRLIPAEKDSDGKKAKTPPSNLSVLHLSVQHGLSSVVAALLSSDADRVAALLRHRDSRGATTLHYASREASSAMADIAEALLASPEGREAVAAMDDRGRTPLHLAANAATASADVSTETAELLLRSAADTRALDARGRTPLHYAFVKIGDHKNATYIDPIALVSVLLKNIKDAQLAITDHWGNSVVHYAALRGSNICLMSLLRRSVPIEVANKEGNTPLALSVLKGHKASALTLLQANASIREKVHCGLEGYASLAEYESETEWRWAPTRDPRPAPTVLGIPDVVVRNEWQGVVYVMLEQMGGDAAAVFFLVKAAVEFRKLNLALTLVRGHRAIFAAKAIPQLQEAHDGANNLFRVLAEFGHGTADAMLVKVGEMLVSIGIPWFSDRGQGLDSRPLALAAESGHLALLSFFEEHHPSGIKGLARLRNLRKAEQTNILAHLMSEENRGKWVAEPTQEWFARLVKAGADVNDVGCAFPGIADVADASGRADLSRQPPLVQTTSLLIRAVQTAHFEYTAASGTRVDEDWGCRLVKRLVAMGADVNRADEAGLTPLMHAVRHNHVNIVKLLMNPEFTEAKTPDTSRHQFSFGRVRGRQFAINEPEEDDEDMEEEEDEEEDEGFDDDDEEAPPKKRSKQAAPLKRAMSSFAVKSNLNVMARDGQGRTAAERAALPLDESGVVWEAKATVALLREKGCPAKNKAKTTRAVEFFGTEAGWVRPAVAKEPDVAADADTFRRQEQEQQKKLYAQKRAAVEASLRRPHKLSGYRETGDIVRDADSGLDFNVLLNKTDMAHGMFGFYNFYRLELVQRRGAELFVVFTNWGRIGDEGQFQRTPFRTLADAAKEFRSIFRAKTGNDFGAPFEEKLKKYHLITRDLSEWEKAASVAEMDIDLHSPVQSKLPEKLQQVMSDIADVKDLQTNTRHVISFSHQLLTPFGLLKKEKILKAREVLLEIGKLIVDLETTLTNIDGKENLDKALRIRTELADRSNAFYQLVPMCGMENSQLQVIDNSGLFNDFYNNLQQMLEFEVAGEVVTGAALRRSSVSPLDYVYAALGVQAAALEPASPVAQHILHYIANSAPETHVTAIFALSNANADFPGAAGNRMMLWHGTRNVNLISILKRGLLPAPPTSLHAGYTFGKGIYTADTFAKSAAYCGSGGSGRRYALLCEVALGAAHNRPDVDVQFSKDALPKGKDSLKACGTKAPDPTRHLVLANGALMPLGGLVPQRGAPNEYWGLAHNEFIVFDPKRVAIRYLVQFKD